MGTTITVITTTVITTPITRTTIIIIAIITGTAGISAQFFQRCIAVAASGTIWDCGVGVLGRQCSGCEVLRFLNYAPTTAHYAG
jgi:hypothetical protein